MQISTTSLQCYDTVLIVLRGSNRFNTDDIYFWWSNGELVILLVWTVFKITWRLTQFFSQNIAHNIFFLSSRYWFFVSFLFSRFLKRQTFFPIRMNAKNRETESKITWTALRFGGRIHFNNIRTCTSQTITPC